MTHCKNCEICAFFLEVILYTQFYRIDIYLELSVACLRLNRAKNTRYKQFRIHVKPGGGSDSYICYDIGF